MTLLLKPDPDSQYVVVVGAAGTGKSTAVRKALLDLAKPRGVVYFLPPTLLSGFSSGLASALGYYRPIRWADRVARLLSGESKEEPAAPPHASEQHASWQSLEPVLLSAATNYRDRHKAPAVLVLDGMDLVAREAPDLFLKVQDFAKKCADLGVLRLVLVFSDGAALPLLQSSSAITRADVIYEVGDIADEEASEWLRTHCAVDPDRAAALVSLIAGGRFPLLRKCAASHQPVEAISHEMDVETRDSLRRAGVSPSAPLFRALLLRGQVESADALAMLPEATLQKLLSLNVLSAHPDRTYTFHDRHTQQFFARAGCGRRKWLLWR